MEPTASNSPSDDSVADALRRFGAPHVREVWASAVDRRSSDAKGALTSARELIESVCKHILDEAGIPYDKIYELNQLYFQTAKALEIAPSQQTEYDFRRILGACATIVESVGNLRSDLGDAHGRGKESTRVDLRHAELAVNLAGIMAAYLINTWESRQKTVGDIIKSYKESKSLEKTPRAALDITLRHSISTIVASRLTGEHVLAYCQQRRDAGTERSTIRQDLSYLRNALEYARQSWGLETPVLALLHGARLAREKGLTGQSRPRERRPTPDELERLLAYFEDQDKESTIQMMPLIEFTLKTARAVNEICNLEWKHLNRDHRSYTIPKHRTGSAKMPRDHEFPLTDKAYAIVCAQPQTNKRIFPWKAKSVTARFVRAARDLAIEDLELRDIRFEAIMRLFAQGLAPHVVQEHTGIISALAISRYWEAYRRSNGGRDAALDAKREPPMETTANLSNDAEVEDRGT